MIFKLSFSKLLAPIVRLAIIAAIVTGFAIIEGGGFNSSVILEEIHSVGGILAIAVLSIIFLPTVYLCIEYYAVTKGKTIKITANFIEINNTNGNDTHFLIKDLTLIKVYKSLGGSVASTAAMYYHAELFINDERKIILTSVLEPSIEEALDLLKDVSVEIIGSPFSTTYR